MVADSKLNVEHIDLKRHVSSYGVTAQNTAETQKQIYLEALKHDGFAIIENVLNADELEQVRNAMDRVYAQQMEELGGEGFAEKIHDSNIIRCPMAYDDLFIDLAKNQTVMDVIRDTLGENFVLMMQNGVINKPDNPQQQVKWHRDLNYQHWTSSKPLALNFLYCIDEFTLEMGATHVLAGSHLHENFPSEHYIKTHAQAAIASAGSVIVMDCMTYHRAGENISRNTRRGVNHVVGLPFMSQQIDLPSVFGDRFENDYFLSRYFGYRWRPASSPLEWRERRL